LKRVNKMGLKQIGDLVTSFGLGAVAIIVLMRLVIMLISYIIKDLSGKIDALYEIIDNLRKEIEQSKEGKQ